jgi:hypothetical protein
MSQRLLVRGELSWWVHAGRIAGALALIGGVSAAIGFRLGWGWLAALAGVALWLPLESIAWRARLVRTWLIDGGDSFLVEDRRGQRVVRDERVVALALASKRRLNNGTLDSVWRTFQIWTDDLPEPIVMQAAVRVNESDPLAELINRLHDGLAARLNEQLDRGGTAEGDGWHLSRTLLTIGRAPRDQQLYVQDVTAVEVYDGQMCVWRRGQDEAAARLPMAGRNVWLLPALLLPRIAAQQDDRSESSASGLGRVLFQRKPNAGVVYGLLLAAIACLATGPTLFVTMPRAEDGTIWMLVLVAVGLILLISGLWLAFQAFRCHERGVWQQNLLGQKLLRYEDVGSFTYQAMDHYHNGIYTGTHLTLLFKPLNPSAGRPVRFNTSVRGDDEDLDSLRDSISRIIAARMLAQWEAGAVVPWTANLSFVREGIAYRPGGLLGRKDAQLLPFAAYGGHNLQEGVFYLFRAGDKKPICTEQTSVENFYPGWFLLLALLHAPADDDELATDAASPQDA